MPPNQERRKRRQARRPGVVVGIVGLLIGAPLAAIWYAGHSLATRTEGRASSGVSILANPVLNVRRAAQTLATDIAVRQLRGELSGVIDRLPPQACLRVDAGGRTVVAHSAEEELIPASNMKIATAAVALEVLPPDTQFSTKVFGNLRDGVVEGDLFLVGGGDPLLVSQEHLATERYPTISPSLLDKLADQVRDAGVVSIRGSVVGDESFLDNDRYVDDWGSGIRGTEGGPLGALMVNDGAIVGNPIKPDNPALAAATEFERLLKARGVQIDGPPRSTSDAAAVDETKETPIAELKSEMLPSVIEEMLTNSDNNTAELLLRHVGLTRSLQPTTAAGIAVVESVLESWGIGGVTVKDGSGLSRSNRMTCSALTAIIEKAPFGATLRKGFAVAGQSGTLGEVFLKSPVTGKLLGKTGTLLNVKTLGGVLPVGGSDEVVFALFLNGAGWADQGNYRPIWEALGEALAGYPVGPSKDQVSVIGGS